MSQTSTHTKIHYKEFLSWHQNQHRQYTKRDFQHKSTLFQCSRHSEYAKKIAIYN